MPSFIYFDLDDTLLDHRRAERSALADVCSAFDGVFARFDVAHVQEIYHRFNEDLWHRYSHGEIAKEDLKRLRFERLLEALATDGAEPDALSNHYLDCYARHWTFVDGAREAFHAIADRYRVGILTNGFSEIQHAKVERFPELRVRVEAFLISEEVGFMKPDRRLFEHAAAVAGVPPGEILYVGDSYNSDVRGALGAGWQVAWFRGDPARVADQPVLCFSSWPVLVEHLT